MLFNWKAGPVKGGFRGYIVPGLSPRGPGLKGPGRVQVSALSIGIAPQHRNQTCLQQKYQSAYSILVIGRFFCYTAFRTSNSGRFKLKKRKMYQKSYTCTEINALFNFSDLRALILQYSNVRGLTFPELSISTSESGVKVDILYYYH